MHLRDSAVRHNVIRKPFIALQDSNCIINNTQFDANSGAVADEDTFILETADDDTSSIELHNCLFNNNFQLKALIKNIRVITSCSFVSNTDLEYVVYGLIISYSIPRSRQPMLLLVVFVLLYRLQ
eukprot:256639_1